LVDVPLIEGGVGLCPMPPCGRQLRLQEARTRGKHAFTRVVQRLVIAREMLKETRAFLLAGVG
jgi:hypothetical protein